LAVNKIDVPRRQDLAHEFHSLGFERLLPVSAEHGLGVDDLLDEVSAGLPEAADSGEEAVKQIKVAIIGRPNVGKSTLLNALAGSERAIVSPVAGTTRDAVDETVRRDGTDYVFVDTAGIRRKGKTKLMAEKLSVVMARRHIRMANVVLLILDAAEGVVGLDSTIGGYAHEGGRSIILCVNKWDAAPDKNKQAFVARLRDEMKFLDYAPVAFVSALEGAGIEQLYALIRRAFAEASRRITTGELNRFFAKLELDRDLRVKYITQVSVRPPTFVLFADSARELHFSTERFVANRIRETFGFFGTPLVVKARSRPDRPSRARGPRKRAG
jgi:GTP-binding protein